MPRQTNIEEKVKAILEEAGYTLHTLEPIQTLWAGYGQICRVKVTAESSTSVQTLILKHVTPPETKGRKIKPDEGHLRKVLSYQVEQSFYRDLAPHMPPEIGVAQCLWSYSSSTNVSRASDSFSLLMTDLREPFPVAAEKRGALNENQVCAAISWLARFHGFWWHDRQHSMLAEFEKIGPPLEHWKQQASTDVRGPAYWANGGYTYLATRRSEYGELCADDSKWTSVLCEAGGSGMSLAEKVAKILHMARTQQTLIHGDVKSENMFTTEDGKQVAFFDFQYIGQGLGVCDLAKLFTCSVPLSMLIADNMIPDKLDMQLAEQELLRAYLKELEASSGKEYQWDVMVRHWETALVDWLRFQASWGFWGNTEWLEARVRAITSDETWISWIDSTLKDC